MSSQSRNAIKWRPNNQSYQDGYHLRKTDEGWIFIEGVPCCAETRFFTDQEYANFNACLKRRGIPKLKNKR